MKDRVIDWQDSLFGSQIEPITPINVPINLQLNKRQLWFLNELSKGEKLKSPHFSRHWKVSDKTSKRDISFLQECNLIEYEGSLKTGHYKIKQQNDSNELHK